MRDTDGPIQMVTDGKNHLPAHPVGTDDVNDVRLLYGHRANQENEAPPGDTFFLDFVAFLNS
jgi:hypothetical protein